MLKVVTKRVQSDGFHTMVVVDDQIERVWNQDIPKFLEHSSTGIMWVTPLRFDMNEDEEYPKYVDVSIVDLIKHKRDGDDLFERLTTMCGLSTFYFLCLSCYPFHTTCTCSGNYQPTRKRR